MSTSKAPSPLLADRSTLIRLQTSIRFLFRVRPISRLLPSLYAFQTYSLVPKVLPQIPLRLTLVWRLSLYLSLQRVARLSHLQHMMWILYGGENLFLQAWRERGLMRRVLFQMTLHACYLWLPSAILRPSALSPIGCRFLGWRFLLSVRPCSILEPRTFPPRSCVLGSP